jgi:hypothetical protein
VSGNPDGDGNFEETNSKLAKGLKSCRTVLNNYRALLSSEPNADWSQPNAALDNPLAEPAGPDLIEG